MSAEAVAALIRTAWKEAVAPSDEELVIPTYDDEGAAAYFRGKSWYGHEAKALERHDGGTIFLAPRAFAYYLPASMLLALAGKSQRLGSSVASALSPRHLSHTWAASYRAKVAALAGAQREAVIAFLRWYETQTSPDPIDPVAVTIAFLERGEEPVWATGLERLLSRGWQRDRQAVTRLSLSSVAFEETDLEALRELPRLASLDLSNTDVTDKGLAYVAAVTSLQKLRLGGARKITALGLSAISRLPILESLSLPNITVGDEGLRALSPLALRELDLIHAGPMSPAGWDALEVRRLAKLNAYGLDLPDELLGRLAKNGVLAQLTLSGASALGVAALGDAKVLANLRLAERATVDDAALAALARLPALVELSIFAGAVTRWPSQPHDFPALDELTLLSGAPRQGSGFGAPAMQRLRRFSLFAEAPPPGALELAGLAGLPALQRLTIWSDGITDETLRDLRGAPALAEVHLKRRPAITSVGLAALAELPALRTLCLGDGLPGLAGGQLAALRDLPHLSRLELEYVRLSDEQLEALAAVTQLRALSLQSCELAPDAVERLRAALPGAEIVVA